MKKTKKMADEALLFDEDPDALLLDEDPDPRPLTKEEKKLLRKRLAEKEAEEKRVLKVFEEQEASRKKIRKTKRGLEPQHAVISCPDCAAQLLIGVDFLKHRI